MARAAEIEAAEAARREREAGERRFWIDHQQQLLQLGKDMPAGSGHSTFVHAGCVASLLGILADGAKTRDEIMGQMRGRYRYSYRHAGFLLTKLTGNDRRQHLWSKGDDRLYRLLTPVPQGAFDVGACDGLWRGLFR